ncbi:unnamed protein product [Closterium sp. Naga37s-1]|nr:unnamed protein product [Closterium sp. Naga37s-1]
MDHDSGEGKLESVPKFDGSDYWTWGFRFEQWAEAHDLWGYFDGSEERPASGDAWLKWERKNRKAFAQFCNALVPDELICLVREFGGQIELGSAPVDGGARAVIRVPAGTAAAYTRVKEFYLQRGLCNRMALSEELSSLKMKEGEGVAAYWALADDLRSNYLAAGGKEEVEEWIMRVLKGLPPHFEMLKVVLNNQSSSLTKDQLLTSLRSEEMRIGVAPRSDGVATFGAGTKVGSSSRGNWDKGGKHGGSGSSSGTNLGKWGQGKGKAERGGRGSNGKAHVADEEEQDDKAEVAVGEAVAAVGGEQVGPATTLLLLHQISRVSLSHLRFGALPASITPMEAWSGQKPHVGMARIWGCMGSVMLHGHEKGGKLDARAVMCVCVGVDMESKGWRMLDPSLMRIRIARDVDFLENVTWKDWDKAKGFGELLQDAAEISQLLPLPLSPPSAAVDDAEMPPSSPPPAPLIVSVQQQPTPLQQLSGPSVIQRRSATQASSSSSSSGQRPVTLSSSEPLSPVSTSPPPVTSLQVLGVWSGIGGEEVGGDAGVVEGMMCLAREVEGVALAGVSTGDVSRTLAEALRGPGGPVWKAGAEKEVNAMRTMGRTKHIKVAWHFVRDAVRQQEVEVHSVRSHLQDADMLTKALPSLQLHENLERIGMRVMSLRAKASFAKEVVF